MASTGSPPPFYLKVAISSAGEELLLTDGGIGLITHRATTNDFAIVMATSTPESQLTLDAQQVADRLRIASGHEIDANIPVLPRYRALWWHRIVLSGDTNRIESLSDASSIGVPGTDIRIGHGYSACQPHQVHDVLLGLSLAYEEWVVVTDLNSQTAKIALENFRSIHDAKSASSSALRPRLTELSSQTAARSAWFRQRKSVTPDLPLSVWETAQTSWRVDASARDTYDLQRSLDKLIGLIRDEEESRRAIRRNALLFVITALSLLQLLPAVVDFATNPNAEIANSVRLGLAAVVFVTAVVALAVTFLKSSRKHSRAQPD